MREIKFRAWDDERKVMVHTFDGEIVILNHDTELIASSYDINKDYYEMKLMQFTGLEDKNGKDIYEGDIVSTDGGSIIGSIKWIDIKGEDYAGFGIRDDLNKEWYWFSDHYVSEDLEVIGNIYRNPELLKGGSL